VSTLDCRIFGALKAKGQAHMAKLFADHILLFFDPVTCSFPSSVPPLPKMDYFSAMIVLEESWQSINEYLLETAWMKALYNDWEDDDSVMEIDQEIPDLEMKVDPQQNGEIIHDEQSLKQILATLTPYVNPNSIKFKRFYEESTENTQNFQTFSDDT